MKQAWIEEGGVALFLLSIFQIRTTRHKNHPWLFCERCKSIKICVWVAINLFSINHLAIIHISLGRIELKYMDYQFVILHFFIYLCNLFYVKRLSALRGNMWEKKLTSGLAISSLSGTIKLCLKRAFSS